MLNLYLGFPGGSDGKESACSWETWVRSLRWEDPLQKGMTTYSSNLAWRIPMDRGVWQATAHGVAKGQTWLRDKAHKSSLIASSYCNSLSFKKYFFKCFSVTISIAFIHSCIPSSSVFLNLNLIFLVFLFLGFCLFISEFLKFGFILFFCA